jgi:acetyltransferase-like isoleucine patch superfamily enzyme
MEPRSDMSGNIMVYQHKIRTIHRKGEMSISEMAVVETENIGSRVRIGAYSVVRAGVRLGDDVVIHPHTVIEAGVTLGNSTEVLPGAYIGKEPKGAGALARTLEYEKELVIGANCSIGTNSVIYYDVTVGENTLIGDGASIREQCVVGTKCVIGMHVTVGYEVSIGNQVKIMDHTHVVGTSVIKDDVFIGPNVGMANDNALGQEGYSEEMVIGPTIEDGTMIGLGANLLPGVIVGERAIVGAGTLVTKHVEPGTVVMGVPARFVRRAEAGEQEGSRHG